MTTAKYAGLFPHVASRWRELVHILVHGAANLPLIDGRTPECFVTAQSNVTLTTREVGQVVNATNAVEGVSPQWNEMIYAEISEEDAHSEEIVLLVIDKQIDASVAEYRFPWKWFEPFYQYHLNLEHTSQQTGQKICLYISIMLKKSSLSKENIRYYGLEALLNGFDVPLTGNQAMYAVARIVPNYKSYKHDYLSNPDQETLGVVFQRIAFSNSQEFFLPEFSHSGYPQLSLASKASKLAIWKHIFFFSHPQDKDHMFTTRAGAIVIEFYPFHNISNSTNWRITGLLGWIAVLLDSRSYDALTSSMGSEGIRTEGLVVESEGDLMADNAKYLTAELYLRLVTERHPSKNLILLSEGDRPVLPSYFDQATRQRGIDPVYLQAPASKRTLLPAIKPARSATPPVVAHSPAPAGPPTFLPPQFYYPPRYDVAQPAPPVQLVQPAQAAPQQTDRSNNFRYRIPRIDLYDVDDIPTEYRAMLGINYPPRRDDDIDGWFDYFQRVIMVYKQAIRRVIQDVIQLRDQQKTLTAANRDLKTKVENFDKKRKILHDVFEGDKIDKAKLQDIYNRFTAKISAQSLEIKENYARINSYEKELARRGELRAQYDALVRTTQARETELQLMKDRISKAEGLEETVRRQELVIEKLEAMINNYMKQKRTGGAFNDLDRNFLSEHAALGLETEQLQRRAPAERHTAMVNSHRDDLIRQNLAYEQELANINARFRENAAAWGKEKAELLERLDDQEPPATTARSRGRK